MPRIKSEIWCPKTLRPCEPQQLSRITAAAGELRDDDSLSETKLRCSLLGSYQAVPLSRRVPAYHPILSATARTTSSMTIGRESI